MGGSLTPHVWVSVVRAHTAVSDALSCFRNDANYVTLHLSSTSNPVFLSAVIPPQRTDVCFKWCLVPDSYMATVALTVIMGSPLLRNFGFRETETVSPQKNASQWVAFVLSFYPKTIYGDLLLDFQIYTSLCIWINIMQGNMEPEISMAVRKQTNGKTSPKTGRQAGWKTQDCCKETAFNIQVTDPVTWIHTWLVDYTVFATWKVLAFQYLALCPSFCSNFWWFGLLLLLYFKRGRYVCNSGRHTETKNCCFSGS